jgi:hypothetical protein
MSPLLVGADASAQDAAALRDSVAAMRVRAAQAREALDASIARARETPDDSVQMSGATVLFRRADLPAREVGRLRAAFARVEAQLERQLGPRGVALLASTRWSVRVYTRPGVMAAPSMVFAQERALNQMGAPVVSFPVDVDYVATLVRRGVGDELLRQLPWLGQWLGGAFALDEAATTYYFASRDLALNGGAKAARCGRGVIEDCLVLFDRSRFREWADPGERRRTGVAVSTTVRASVLQYAIARAGPDLLDALHATAADASVVGALAAAAGETPEAFVSGWQAAVAEGGALRVRVAPRMFLTSAGWILLFAAAATRRRPR